MSHDSRKKIFTLFSNIAEYFTGYLSEVIMDENNLCDHYHYYFTLLLC